MGAMSSALWLEFTLALDLLARGVAGASYPLFNIVVAFGLVGFLYRPLETWLWGENTE